MLPDMGNMGMGCHIIILPGIKSGLEVWCAIVFVAHLETAVDNCNCNPVMSALLSSISTIVEQMFGQSSYACMHIDHMNIWWHCQQ